MRASPPLDPKELLLQLAEAKATIDALLSEQVDAVVDAATKTPVLLSKAQAALRESEERYRRIVETTVEGIWTLDTDCKVTFVNRRLADMLGHSVDEMLGSSLFDYLPVARHASARSRIERARKGASEEYEVGAIRKDGSVVWMTIRSTPIRDDAGNYIGLLAMMTDLTRDKASDEALRKTEEQYRRIVETTSDGILQIDTASKIVFVNQRLAEMLQYEPQEMIGASIFDFMSGAAKELCEDGLDRRGKGIREVVDNVLRRKDGIEVAVSMSSTPLLDDDAGYTGTLSMVRDVTEQRKLQAQLMVSDRMASVGTLAAGIAHEINNPLAAVLANLEYIASAVNEPAESDADLGAMGSPRLAAELKEPLDDARQAAERVKFIVRDLMVFSRSPTKEHADPVDVESIMDASLRMGWNEIRHRARLIKRYGQVPHVQANEARLGQVFLNLIVNAAQALPAGRADDNEICVTTRVDGGRVVIEVSDTGPGIAPEIIGRIFDAFFTTKAVGVGTGLGLAICHRIVTDMGGELTVETAAKRGTTFRVLLPLATGRESSIPPSVSRPPVAGRRGRILVVDDEVLVLRAVKRTLAPEHEIVTVSAAREALALVAAGETFDLILCDLMMPDMTGMDLDRALCAIRPEQAAKMVFLTGGAFTPSAQHFLADLSREHLDKPFDAAHLRAVVQRHVR